MPKELELKLHQDHEYNITQDEIDQMKFDQKDLEKIKALFLTNDFKFFLFMALCAKDRVVESSAVKAISGLINEIFNKASPSESSAEKIVDRDDMIKLKKLSLIFFKVMYICKKEQDIATIFSLSQFQSSILFEIVDFVNSGDLKIYESNNFEEFSKFAKKDFLRDSPILYEMATFHYRIHGNPSVFREIGGRWGMLSYCALTGSQKVEQSQLTIQDLVILNMPVLRTIDKAMLDLDEDLIRQELKRDVQDYIRGSYSCFPTKELGFVKVPALYLGKKPFELLLAELSQASTQEIVILYATKSLPTLKIKKLEELFLCYEKSFQDFRVITFGTIINYIALEGKDKKYKGEKFTYEKVVKEILNAYVFKPEVEKMLFTRLLTKEFEESFNRYLAEESRNFGFSRTNSHLEDLMENFEYFDSVLRFSIYGDRVFSDRNLSLLRNGRKVFLSEKLEEDQSAIPKFDGIEFRHLGNHALGVNYEFIVTNAKLAEHGFEDFLMFFRTKSFEYFSKIQALYHKAVEGEAITNENLDVLLKRFQHLEEAFLSLFNNLDVVKNSPAGVRVEGRKIYLDWRSENIKIPIFHGIEIMPLLNRESKPIYEIYVVDPKQAVKGITELAEFLSKKRDDFFNPPLLEKEVVELEKIAGLLRKHLKTNTEFSLADKDILRKRIKIITRQTELVGKLVKAEFDGIKFEKDKHGLVLQVIHLDNLPAIFDKLAVIFEDKQKPNTEAQQSESKDQELAAQSLLEQIEREEATNNQRLKKQQAEQKSSKKRYQEERQRAQEEARRISNQAVQEQALKLAEAEKQKELQRLTNRLRHLNQEIAIVEKQEEVSNEEAENLEKQIQKEEKLLLDLQSAKVVLADSVDTQKELGRLILQKELQLNKISDYPNESCDLQILEILEERIKFGFQPEIIEKFPQSLKKLVQRLNENLDVVTPSIYGGFVNNGRNPKDIDFQIVVRDLVLHKDDKDVLDFFRKIIPEELLQNFRMEKKITNPPVWRVDIGRYVQLTFIEESDNNRNRNWTSTLDAQYYNLREKKLEYQPDFKRVCSLTRKDPTEFIINRHARNAYLRVAYAIIPKIIEDETVISQLIPSMQAPILREPFGGRLQELMKRIEDFCQNHVEKGDEEAVFNKNITQIIKKLPKDIFDEAEQKLLAEKIKKFEQDYKVLIIEKEPKKEGVYRQPTQLLENATATKASASASASTTSILRSLPMERF